MEKNDRFHAEDYHIVGNRAEIDRIARSQGFINIGMADIISTLSADSTNYITKGEAEGEDCVVRAMKEAVGKLPAGTEGTSRILFDIRIPKQRDPKNFSLSSFAAYLNELDMNIDVIWGAAFDESLGPEETRVTLIASENKSFT